MDHGCETYRGFNGYAGDAENRNPVRPDLGELGAVQKDWPGRKVIQNNEKNKHPKNPGEFNKSFRKEGELGGEENNKSKKSPGPKQLMRSPVGAGGEP